VANSECENEISIISEAMCEESIKKYVENENNIENSNVKKKRSNEIVNMWQYWKAEMTGSKWPASIEESSNRRKANISNEMKNYLVIILKSSNEMKIVVNQPISMILILKMKLKK